MSHDSRTEPSVHPFEQAGLGKAPYRYVGAVEQPLTLAGTVVVGHIGGCAVETKPGGTCDYCGQGILNMYRVRSSDGLTFKVGCDCLRKVDIVNPRSLKADIKKATDARSNARIEDARVILRENEAVRAWFAGKPHPTAWGERNGLTLLSYVEWLLVNSGMSGRLNAARMIEREHKKTA